MDPTEVFSAKAHKYARYRWDYAPQAIHTILDVTGISHDSVVADIGAGTGILAKHFVGKVKRIFVVEPNAEMRRIADRDLEVYPACHIVDGRAEVTTLPDHTVDLVTVAQAIHWFDPYPTRTEFLRILKPGGWLAILRNYGTDRERGKALAEVFPIGGVLDTSDLMVGRDVPKRFYYGDVDVPRQIFAFTTHQTWDAFLGALGTASDAPDETSSPYADFERAARRVFDRFATGDRLESHAVTELYLGQVIGP